MGRTSPEQPPRFCTSTRHSHGIVRERKTKPTGVFFKYLCLVQCSLEGERNWNKSLFYGNAKSYQKMSIKRL